MGQSTITSHYISKMPQNLKQALALKERLEASRQKAFDAPIKSQHESQYQEEVDVAVIQPRSLTAKLISRTWIQRSFIIFIHLHPQMGNKDLEYTCSLTGVKGNTLLGWLLKPKMMECWINIVASMKASDTLKSLPSNLQDCFNEVDGSSVVCLRHYRNRIKPGNQPKIIFTGIDVSIFYIVCLCLMFTFTLTSLNLFSLQFSGKGDNSITICKS